MVSPGGTSPAHPFTTTVLASCPESRNRRSPSISDFEAAWRFPGHSSNLFVGSTYITAPGGVHVASWSYDSCRIGQRQAPTGFIYLVITIIYLAPLRGDYSETEEVNHGGLGCHDAQIVAEVGGGVAGLHEIVLYHIM